MNQASIFIGVTSAPCRDLAAKYLLAAKASKLVMPCVGRFTVVEACIKRGAPPHQVYASDIGLFSSIVGYLGGGMTAPAVTGKLSIRADLLFPTGSELTEPLDEPAQILMLMRYGQLKPANPRALNQHALNLRAEMRRRWLQYRDEIRCSLANLVDAIRGINYEIADVWEILRRDSTTADNGIFVNVPAYGNYGGSRRGSAEELITWDAPAISQYDHGQFHELLSLLEHAPAPALVYVQRSLDPVRGKDWRVIYAQPCKNNRTDYLVANRPAFEKATAVSVYASQSTAEPRPQQFPIYNDELITQDTEVSFVRVDRATALYYRDLFVHKLGNTSAGTYYLMLLDGRVVTALGLNNSWLRKFKSPYIGELFGISKSSTRYARLGKLFMLCLTSGDFKRLCITDLKLGVHEPRGIRTTSITTHGEGKTDRSVMRVASRKLRNDGRYHIVYEADFRPDTWKDCISLWLKKWGHINRELKS